MTNADQYLALFSSLEMLLRKRARVNEDYIDFHQVINTLVGDRKDRVVQQYERELKSFGALRNAIAHNYSKEPLADPRLDTITHLEDIINKLTSPQLAANIMSLNPTCFFLDKPVREALSEMATNGFTSIPVYDGDVLVGILSERSALIWVSEMLRDENVLLAETKTMRDIQKYLDPITGGKFDQYVFVKKDLDVFSIKDLFDNAIAHKQRLSAVFVTESGKSTQSLLGIITAWDLYRVE